MGPDDDTLYTLYTLYTQADADPDCDDGPVSPPAVVLRGLGDHREVPVAWGRDRRRVKAMVRGRVIVIAMVWGRVVVMAMVRGRVVVMAMVSD